MQAKHLLSCSSCGKELPVGRQQAGETIHCACGATLEVPTLLKLSKLPVAPEPDAAEPPAKAWGFGERLILSGAIVCVLSLATVAILLVRFPERPVKTRVTPEQAHEFASRLSASECFWFWRRFQANGVQELWLADQLGYHEAVIQYEEKRLAYQMGIGVLSAFCAAGIGLVIAGSIKRAPRSEGKR